VICRSCRISRIARLDAREEDQRVILVLRETQGVLVEQDGMLECRAVQVLAGLRIQRRRIVDADLAVAGFGVDRVALDVELDLATPAGDAIRRLEAIALPCVWRLGHEVGLAIAAFHQSEPQPEMPHHRATAEGRASRCPAAVGDPASRQRHAVTRSPFDRSGSVAGSSAQAQASARSS